MQEVPDAWKGRLRAHLKEHFGEDRDTLVATDFRTCVHLRFGDGSTAYFNFAFYLLDRDRNEIIVFTEHCGYHIFPLGDTSVELLKSVWTDVG